MSPNITHGAAPASADRSFVSYSVARKSRYSRQAVEHGDWTCRRPFPSARSSSIEWTWKTDAALSEGILYGTLPSSVPKFSEGHRLRTSFIGSVGSLPSRRFVGSTFSPAYTAPSE